MTAIFTILTATSFAAGYVALGAAMAVAVIGSIAVQIVKDSKGK